MQRDTSLAFQDIYETPDLMLASFKKICHPLNLTTASSIEALDLRFLTFDNNHLPDLLLSLTDKGQHVGETNYVAVSYTWQRFDPITNSDAVSKYKIVVGDSVRKARTQDAVLFRAVRFAKANNCRFIWADQDCIDQTDSEDVERHSHVVHTIFYQSQHSIGLLSFHLFHQNQVDLLRYVTNGTCLRDLDDLNKGSEAGKLQFSRDLMKALRLFAAIAEDKWFTRAWVLMERLSAPHMRLLLPFEAALSADDAVSGVPAEIEISCNALHQLRKHFIEMFKTHSSGTNGQVEQEGSQQALGGIINRFAQLLSTKYSAHSDTPPWLQPLTFEHITKIFWDVEKCDNTVLSDKLLIMSYLCGFSIRFNRKSMNNYEYSYSTGVLVLLLLNGWLPRRCWRTDALFIWNHSLGELLVHWQPEEQRSTTHRTLDQADKDSTRLQQILRHLRLCCQ
ncbi:hypothetical protein LZ30DRAFT_719978 [Colletotrichum cereale]|nr:hypothetical protein LZ30DRAFT_719978 [Colletotrichum cereale]